MVKKSNNKKEVATSNTKESVKEKDSKKSLKIKVMDNKVPQRGTLWYVLFTLAFLISVTLIIFFSDWALLFFVVVFSGITLWRGHISSIMDLEIDDKSVKVNKKEFLINQIDHWYFSSSGDDFTITIQMIQRYLPRLTYTLTNPDNLEKIREKLGGKAPEIEQRNENFIDFFIRKLKI